MQYKQPETTTSAESSFRSRSCGVFIMFGFFLLFTLKNKRAKPLNKPHLELEFADMLQNKA